MDWYFERGAGQEGPVPGSVLEGMLADGSLRPDNKVWRKGLPEWARAGDVADIQPPGGSPQPPPPVATPPPLSTPPAGEPSEAPSPAPASYAVERPAAPGASGAPTYVERPADSEPSGGAGAPLASLEARFLGAMVDGFIYAPLFFLMAMGEEDPGLLAVGFAGVMALVGYQAYLVTTTGQSIGKKAMKTKILKTDGSEVDFVSGVLIRTWAAFFIQVVPVIGSLFGLGDSLAIFFGEGRQTLHDLMADTKVVQHPR